MKFTLYTADCSGNEQNCQYPHEVHVDSADSLSAAAAKDHVCASFKDNHRSVADFMACDVIMLDCDNDHSEDSAAWVTSEQLAAMMPDLAFAATPSRHDRQEKDGKSARPRWHAYFPVNILITAQKCRTLKAAVQGKLPFFDPNCLDAARFVYGSEAGAPFWHEGSKTIDQMLQPAHTEHRIPAGQRNSTMSHFAGRVVKRYGATDRAHEIFMEEAAKCVPPLSDEELSKIWHSAEKFCEMLKKQPGYVPPESYEFSNWENDLLRDKKGNVLNTLQNLLLILQNDPALESICFNQLADNIEIRGEAPWRHPAQFWRDADDAQLICYVDGKYGTFSRANYMTAVTKVTDDRAYHPILDYLDSLPAWDGVERLDTLLIDYLGAEDNEYVRAVTRKTLVAGIMRVLHPGIKFDTILVLNGPQGIGKSTLISKLGREWYSDSLTLTDMNDKTAAEKLQGYWLLEIGELAGMRKADIDRVKAFASRQDDKYRASFGRRVTPHPRQCVFFGTTNSECGYLRDVTGNRRFWTVKTPGRTDRHPWEISEEDVRQIWAEAVQYAEAGEKLFLPPELETISRKEQNASMEQDDREGLVRAYLDMFLPENWDDMDLYQRRDYVDKPDAPLNPAGMIQRQIVCNMAIWCECFGKRREDLRSIDSYAIAAIMTRIEEWEKTGRMAVFPLYGKQRVYQRR